MTQAMNAQVSLGSQPQYRPQAASAHIAPAAMPNVHTGNPKATVRYATWSSSRDSGSREPRLTGNRIVPAPAATRRSYRSRIRYSTEATKLTRKVPVAVIAAVTWMASQYDRSAGTSGAAFAYSTVPARNISRITGNITNMPRYRIRGCRASTTQNAATATKPTAEENSYMLPHGIRSTAVPRSTIEVRCPAAPSRVSSTASRPNRCAGRFTTASRPNFSGDPAAPSPASPDTADGADDVGGADGATSGPPAPTSTFAVAGTAAVSATRPRRPNAYSPQ